MAGAQAPSGERIAKRLARAGIASRRAAERMIAEGRIAIDGVTIAEPGTRVAAGAAITVDGKPVAAPAPTILARYHKPRGLLCTNHDPQGRPTIFDEMPKDLPRLVTVGRLDLNSEGLLLLTNDGALARRLELPATGWLRRYRARVYGEIDSERLARLAHGIEIAGVRYGPIRVTIERADRTNSWLAISLAEGKNREVRRVLEHLGLSVSRLIRIAYGPFQLGTLPPGEIARVPAKILAEQIGASAPEAPERDAHRRR